MAEPAQSEAIPMLRFFLIVVMLFALTSKSTGQISSTFNSSEWHSWVNGYTTIDFLGYPDATPISNQYSNLGVLFTAPTFIFQTGGFQDGWGIDGPNGLHLLFDHPQNWIAIDHAGNAQFQLYSNGTLIGQSGFDPIGGWGSFLGVTSRVSFNEVVITKPPFYGTHIGVDNLYWGAPVPAPGVVGVFALAGLLPRRRRRGSYGLRHQRFSMRGCS